MLWVYRGFIRKLLRVGLNADFANVEYICSVVIKMLPNDNKDVAILHVSDTFNITGRGCVVCGSIKQGIFRIRDRVKILRSNEIIAYTDIVGIEMINYGSNQIHRTDNIGLLLQGISKDDILKDDYIVQII